MIRLAAILLLLSGCWQSREQARTVSEKADTVRLTGTVSLPGSDGIPVLLPIDLTADRQGTEQQTEERERQSSLDGAAIGREIGAAVRTAIGGASGGGFNMAGIMDALTGGVTAAGLGYLALKKRQQLKQTIKES